MADDTLIAKALEQIAHHETEAVRLRQWVNDADVLSGRPPRFEDVLALSSLATGGSASASPKRWQPAPGDFLGKPLSTAVKIILSARYDAAGGKPSPATVDEIHEAMTQGSYAFETTPIESQKTGIRISIGKNTTAFVKLPNSDSFGLVEWYPGLRRSARGRPRINGIDTGSSPDDIVSGEEAAGDAAADETSQALEGR
jgi:hypothetical protein